MASSMDSKNVLNMYWKPILIFITAIALMALYKSDLLSGFITNQYIYASAESIFAIFITALLLYGAVKLLEKFNKE